MIHPAYFILMIQMPPTIWNGKPAVMTLYAHSNDQVQHETAATKIFLLAAQLIGDAPNKCAAAAAAATTTAAFTSFPKARAPVLSLVFAYAFHSTTH